MIKAFLNLPSVAIGFIRKTINELRHVEWLSWRTVVRMTFTVVVATILVTLIIAGMDKLIVLVRNYLIVSI